MFQEHTSYQCRHGRALRLYDTDRAGHPWGQNLGFAFANSLHLYLFAATRTVLGPFQSYNAVVLLVTLLNYLAFLWLARKLFQSWAVALCAALLFAAAPYLLLKLSLGFMHKYVAFWIPLYGMSLMQLWKTRHARYLAATTALLFLMQITYPPYAVYAGLFTFVLLCFALATRRSPGFALSRFAALVALLGIVSLLYYHAVGFDLQALRSVKEFDSHATLNEGCVNLFNPFYFHPYTWQHHPTHLTLGISATTFALAVVGGVATKGATRWLFGAMLIFLVLAAGPFLRGPGNDLIKIASGPIPLPYYFLAKYLPLAGGIKFPIRILPFVAAPAAVLAGYGMQHLGRRFKRLGPTRVAAICAAAFLAETGVLFHGIVPLRAHEVAVPAIYGEVRDDPSFDAFLNLPHSTERPAINRYGLYTLLAGKAMVNPYSVDFLAVAFPSAADTSAVKADFVERMAEWSVGYVVVHEQFLGEVGYAGREDAYHQWLGEFCEVKRYPDDQVVVYRVPSGPIPDPSR